MTHDNVSGDAVMIDDDILRMYLVDGLSYRGIARVLGKSHEWVRRYILSKRNDPRYSSQLTDSSALRRRHKPKPVEREKDDRPDKQLPPCVICGKLVTRRVGGSGTHRTCSPEHARLWARVRFVLDEEGRQKQRLFLARSILKDPKKHSSGQINWAVGVINGRLPGKPYRPKPGSKVYEAYRQVLEIRGIGEADCPPIS